jgi:MFS family permease
MSSDKSKVASDESSSEVRPLDQIEQPANWSRLRKWSIVVSATLITFMVSFASSVYSAVSRTIASEFNVSPEVSILGVVLYVAAFALGPMIWGPASELYGARELLFFHVCILLTTSDSDLAEHVHCSWVTPFF